MAQSHDTISGMQHTAYKLKLLIPRNLQIILNVNDKPYCSQQPYTACDLSPVFIVNATKQVVNTGT